ncbi:hypothetical protein BPOR_0024g00220 [Botrytis porri]|uniref:Uncharacterized protein n=1 Tax=Botrytis porri TaxID=87229 RepID=A0A4Z1L4B9_9HELO|nr:hypothetical protein BPOR_0024g00220 [Botrytis porri]
MYITKYIELLDLDNLSDLDGVAYDTLVEWMNIGMLLHYHGESNPSILSALSVHYWQSVRSAMYSNATVKKSLKALQDWY